MSDVTERNSCHRADVLIIDDDPTISDLLKDVLRFEGLEVRAALNGAQGLELIAEQRPACVVLDVMMPELDGHSVLRQLRERHGFNLPVIMLTAASDDDQAWRGWAGGVDCFMAKPFNTETLLQRIQALSAPAAADADTAGPHSSFGH